MEQKRGIRSAWLVGFAVLSLLAAASVEAELYRCTGADGNTVFTDQKTQCPGAEPFQPSGVIHSAITPAKRAPSRSGASPLTAAVEAAEAKAWLQKRLDVEEKIDQIAKRRAWMKPYVAHCNRGGYVTTIDDAGIQQIVNCSMLRRDFDSLDALEERARHYLVNVLPNECRKAGCLPGWIR